MRVKARAGHLEWMCFEENKLKRIVLLGLVVLLAVCGGVAL